MPARPLLRYMGGKFLLAPWIVSHFPVHRVYVEPFGGAASVLLHKPPSYAEVYNDLDGDVVNLFRVLRGDDASRLIEIVRNTPFARECFEEAYTYSLDPVEEARRLIVRSFMGFGSNATVRDERGHRVTGFRANSNRSGTTPAMDWANYPDALPVMVKRLRGIVVESRPAVQVMAAHDSADTLHFVDPPYVHATRSPLMADGTPTHKYRHEMSDDEHVALLAFLRALKGAVVLSGYPHPLYDDGLPGWQRVEREALADGARPRVECLWINPKAAAGRKFTPAPVQLDMIGGQA